MGTACNHLWGAGSDNGDVESRGASEEPYSSSKPSQGSPRPRKGPKKSWGDDDEDSASKEDFWDEEDELEEYIMKRDLGQIKEPGSGSDSSSSDSESVMTLPLSFSTSMPQQTQSNGCLLLHVSALQGLAERSCARVKRFLQHAGYPCVHPIGPSCLCMQVLDGRWACAIMTQSPDASR